MKNRRRVRWLTAIFVGALGFAAMAVVFSYFWPDLVYLPIFTLCFLWLLVRMVFGAYREGKRPP